MFAGIHTALCSRWAQFLIHTKAPYKLAVPSPEKEINIFVIVPKDTADQAGGSYRTTYFGSA